MNKILLGLDLPVKYIKDLLIIKKILFAQLKYSINQIPKLTTNIYSKNLK